MRLRHLTSPHAHSPVSTQRIMTELCLAALPGIAVLGYFFGAGVWINVIAAMGLAVLVEAIMLRWRARPLKPSITDGSALVTGLLLGLALPPTVPWWTVLIGVIAAIAVAKHLYGGLGQNPLNPAMVGYVVLLISFPVEMTRWLPPSPIANDTYFHGIVGSLTHFFSLDNVDIDAYTAATGLDALKTAASQRLTPAEAIERYPSLLRWNEGFIAAGWVWSNVAFLLGGLYLLYRRYITWHIPVSFLFALTLFASVGAHADATHGSVIFHLFSGASMLGAFYIATDPVTAATSRKGRLIYGFGIGAFIYIIRTFGSYPDAVAFAVLLMNIAAPTIDYYTRPRTYGHKHASKGWRTK